MKICPACKTQYSDDTLSFCLQDGTPLAGGLDLETPTVTLGEVETAAVRRGVPLNVPIDPASGAWQPSQVTHVASLQPQSKGSNTGIAVAVTAVVMLIVFGGVGIGAWLLFWNGQDEVAKNTGNLSNASDQNAGANTSFPTPQTSPFATPAKTPGKEPSTNSDISPPLPPPVDDSQIRSDVSQKINNWKSLTESKDMNGLRASYAPTLEYYYNKRMVSSGSVIADKERAFRDYSSIRINVSNMNITTDPSGSTARAVYNKAWTFSGLKPFCGSIRSQMQLRKINGAWLIVGERDVPGTFRRTC